MSPLPLPYVQSDIANSDKGHHVQSQSWMLTFADLLSLLLTFFVLIFSMNSVQKEEWQEVVKSLTREFNPTRAQSVDIPAKNVDSTRVFRASSLKLEYVMTLLGPHLRSSAFADAEVNLQDDRLVIGLPSERFLNGMVLSSEANELVLVLADVFAQLSNEIRVGVHTDPTLLSADQILNKREHTILQALSVSDAFYDAGYRSPMTALGYGDARFLQMDEKLSLADRYKMANRVEISIMDRIVPDIIDGE